MEVIDANTMFGPCPRVTADLSLDRLLEGMQSHGVERSLTLSTVGIFHSHNDGNMDTLAQCQGKQQILPVATIDPRGYFGALKQISNLINQGFRMFRFFPGEQGWPLDHAVFEDILNELEPTPVPIMIDAGRTGDASALARILGSKDHPLILDGVVFETLAEAVSVMKKHSNIYVETHALTVPGGLRFLAEQVRGDRIIFGSDCPRSSLAGALRYVQESGLPDPDKEKVLGGNIKRLLGG
ncbi:MAG: amidohydrolase family protein [Armatimonadetes bacterium]|nr:amidohydrolase family protein [Armatimonadota bacterium]